MVYLFVKKSNLTAHFARRFFKNTTIQELKMYKSDNKLQVSFLDFNQPMGLHMNPENRWIKMADMIPWDVFEKNINIFSKARPGMLQASAYGSWRFGYTEQIQVFRQRTCGIDNGKSVSAVFHRAAQLLGNSVI